jgi:hypothetical protein
MAYPTLLQIASMMENTFKSGKSFFMIKTSVTDYNSRPWASFDSFNLNERR